MGFSHDQAVKIMRAAGPGLMLAAIDWAYEVLESGFLPDTKAIEKRIDEAIKEEEKMEK